PIWPPGDSGSQEGTHGKADSHHGQGSGGGEGSRARRGHRQDRRRAPGPVHDVPALPRAGRPPRASGRVRPLRGLARHARARHGRDDGRARARRGLCLGCPDGPGAQARRPGVDDRGHSRPAHARHSPRGRADRRVHARPHTRAPGRRRGRQGAARTLRRRRIHPADRGDRLLRRAGHDGQRVRARGRPGRRSPESRRYLMKRRSIVLALILALLAPGLALAADLPTAKPEQVGLSSERLARITQVLRADVERGRIPGAVVVVARKGRVAYVQAVGFRDKTAGTPMTPDAIFRIASMTKPIVTVAALSLVEEGRLFLSDPVAKYVPALGKMQVGVEKVDPATGKTVVTTVAAERGMTVQDLMRHTSGLTYGNRGSSEIYKMYPESSNWASVNLTMDEF